VLFLHDHPAPARTARIALASGAALALTGWHPVLRAGEHKGALGALVPAGDVKVGDELVCASGAGGAEDGARCAVTAVGAAREAVRYVVTANDRLLAGGVLATAQSTLLGALETAPFKLLARLGLVQRPAVAAALRAALDSPALAAAERLLNAATAAAASRAPAAARTPGAARLVAPVAARSH
jgi:hypothetical protein